MNNIISNNLLVIAIQFRSCVQLFATPWTAACQTSLALTISQSLLKLMSIESAMPFKHLDLCHPLLFLPSIFPSIRVFSNESALHIRWPRYWNFSFSISLFSKYSGLISFRTGQMMWKLNSLNEVNCYFFLKAQNCWFIWCQHPKHSVVGALKNPKQMYLGLSLWSSG